MPIDYHNKLWIMNHIPSNQARYITKTKGGE